jgi:hypothetical protein
MHVFRNVRLVHNVDGDVLPLSHTQERARHLVAVADRADYNLRGQLHDDGRDSKGEVRRSLNGIPAIPSRCRHHRVL